MSTRVVRRTLTLPADLLEAADRAIREGKARSRNEFVAEALRSELAAQERAAIDAVSAAMADDTEYQAEVLAIEAEFATASEEALRLAEDGQ
jgi:metal-responsive CopG/Arc/MetJ family transcriptional regulator